jgi:hypothetical protein
MKTIEEKPGREVLTAGQRFGEIISIIVMLLVFGFFVSHQRTDTGFFAARFGAVEMFCLYGPILLSLFAPAVRALSGRRNPARPLEVATNVFMALAAIWLLLVFPFNFSHLADALPAAIRFVIAWINNDIGKVALILQTIVCPIIAIATTWKYVSVRRREPAHPPAQPAL